MRRSWMIVAALFGCQAMLHGASALDKDKEPAAAPKQGLATFHIGNSLTNTTGKFAEFVRTAGIVHKYQSFTAGGALTWQLWDLQLPKRQKEWDTKIAGYKHIDHFTVQPRDFTKNSVGHEADYAIRFFDVIRKHSPEMQPWFYAEWVEKNRGRPTDQGKMASAQMKQTFPAQTWEESMAAMLLYNEDLQAKVLDTYKEGKRPRVLPSCLAMGWIKNMIDNGKLPGVEKDSFYPLLFSDGVHPNVKGGYLVDLTWYAAFYRESPEGKILPTGTGLSTEHAKVMQKLAWDVVKNYPDCGLYEDGTTPVAGPEFVSEHGAAGKTQTVTLSSKTPGAWFRYTFDGTPPTRTRGYVYCGVVTMPAGATLKAIAYKSGMWQTTPLSQKWERNDRQRRPNHLDGAAAALTSAQNARQAARSVSGSRARPPSSRTHANRASRSHACSVPAMLPLPVSARFTRSSSARSQSRACPRNRARSASSRSLAPRPSPQPASAAEQPADQR